MNVSYNIYRTDLETDETVFVKTMAGSEETVKNRVAGFNRICREAAKLSSGRHTDWVYFHKVVQ